MNLQRAYEVLEVPIGASKQQVRDARSVLIKVWHPDRHENDVAVKTRAIEKLKLLNLAYEIIENAGFPPASPPGAQPSSAPRGQKTGATDQPTTGRTTASPTSASRPTAPGPAQGSAKPRTVVQVDLAFAERVLLEMNLKTPDEILKAAQQRHYAMNLGEAKYLYTVLVARHPGCEGSALAATQLKNLNGTKLKFPGHANTARSAASPPRTPVDESAAAKLRRAYDLHYAKQFHAAREAYLGVLTQFPQSPEARIAKQQLENLIGV